MVEFILDSENKVAKEKMLVTSISPVHFKLSSNFVYYNSGH